MQEIRGDLSDEARSDEVEYVPEYITEEERRFERASDWHFFATHQPPLSADLARTWEPTDYEGMPPTDSDIASSQYSWNLETPRSTESEMSDSALSADDSQTHTQDMMAELCVAGQVVVHLQTRWVNTIGSNYEAGLRDLLALFPRPVDAARIFDIPRSLLLTGAEDTTKYPLVDLIKYRRKIKGFIDSCLASNPDPCRTSTGFATVDDVRAGLVLRM